MTIINVGIIGQGRSGHDIHALALRRLPDLYRIAAVADPEQPYRERAVQQFGCDAYADYRELMDRGDVDLIVNASPSHMHVPLSRAFLERGFHVLCEKPLARSVEEVDALIEAAGRAGKLICAFQQARYSPVFQKIKDIVDTGVLGRIVQVKLCFNSFSRRWDWQTLREHYGGNLLNRGPHPLDQALQFMGADAAPDVVCFMDRVNTYGDAEDFVKVMLSAPGEPLIEVEISSCDAYPQISCQVNAQYGGIVATSAGVRWKYFSPEHAPRQELTRLPLKNADGSPSYGLETLPWTEHQWDIPEAIGDVADYMSDLFYRKLYSAIAEGAPLEVTPRQVRRQIAVIEECHKQNPLHRVEGHGL